MTFEERKNQVKSFLGKKVKMKIDRPIGYVHKKQSYTLTYPINYGFIPDVLGGDGEELDVYLLGVDEPVEEYEARVIGIAHRENDVEDKLIAAPTGVLFTEEEVNKAIDFQERYYDTCIELLEIKKYNCTYQHGKLHGLPEGSLAEYNDGIIIHFRDERYILLTYEGFWKRRESLPPEQETPEFFHALYFKSEAIGDQDDLATAILNIYERMNKELSSDVIVDFEITDYLYNAEIKITGIK